MRSRLLTVVLATALAVGFLGTPDASADPALVGTYAVSAVGPNNQIAVGPDDNMWVTLDGGVTDIARITPAGAVTEFDLPGVAGAVGVAAANGQVWVTYPNGVARFTPGNPVGTTATTAIAAITDPRGMIMGPDGNLWTASLDKVVSITPAMPAAFTVYPATGLVAARAIASGGGSLWIADFAGAQVVKVTPTGTATTFATGGGPQGVAASPAGTAAVANPGTAPQTIGLLPPLVTVPVPATDPFGATYAGDGAFWVAQFLTDSLARLTPTAALTTPIVFPAGSGPRQLTTGPANTLWVTLDTTNRVAQVTGVTAPPTPTPDTLITKAPPGQITTGAAWRRLTFRFTSDIAGAQFSCRLVRFTPARVAPPWGPCTSPTRYRVRSGRRYTFAVRAAAGGVLDPTPAKAKVQIFRRR